MTAPTRPIRDLDVPLPQLKALIARQRLLVGVAAEARHLADPADGAFAALACEHPEACACAADYPDWTPGRAS